MVSSDAQRRFKRAHRRRVESETNLQCRQTWLTVNGTSFSRIRAKPSTGKHSKKMSDKISTTRDRAVEVKAIRKFQFFWCRGCGSTKGSFRQASEKSSESLNCGLIRKFPTISSSFASAFVFRLSTFSSRL